MKKSILLFLIITFSTSIFAQKMSMAYIYPAGGQAGTSFEVEVGGLNINQATEVFISAKGVKSEILKAPENAKKPVRRKFDDQSSPQMADRLKIRITIDKNAPIGLCDFRLQSDKGVSNKLIFEIGQYTDVLEIKGSTLNKPTTIESLPATVCGQILPGERDYFSFKAQKGAVIVASAKARTFVPYIADAVPGWFQAVITIRNSKGKEIAFNDDYRNGVDPVIITNIPEDDIYTLLIHDAIYRGREDFTYRIDVGEIPFIEYIYPAVGKTGKSTTINLKAVNIDKTEVKYKPDFEGKGYFNMVGKEGFKSNSIPFYAVSKTANVDILPKSATLLPYSMVYDSIRTNQKQITYNLELTKNEQLTIELMARKIASMLDAKLTLYNANNVKVAEADDTEDALEGMMTHHADPVLNYKATQAGTYKLVVEDILHGSGLDYFYLLERKVTTPNFKVFVSPANITIPKGGTATFMLDIETPDKKTPRLDLELKGLPKGFTTSSLEVIGAKWEVSVTAPKNAKEQTMDIRLFAKNANGNNAVETQVQEAVPAENMMQAFYYTHHISASSFVAEVVKESPFSLHFSSDIEKHLKDPIRISAKDSIFNLKVEIQRTKGFDEPVSLQLSRKNKQITLDPIEFKAGETEKILRIKLDLKDIAKFKGVRRPLAIVGTVNGKVDKKGKRSFENALYRETTPLLILELKD